MAEEFTSPTTGPSSDEVSLADIVFGSWDSFNFSDDDVHDNHNIDDVLDDNNDGHSIDTSEKNKVFWEEKYHLLKKGILCRSGSWERKVGEATKEIVREMKYSEMVCSCLQKVVAKNCRNCLLREIRDRLLKLGYNCCICKSRWRSSSEIISGIIVSIRHGYGFGCVVMDPCEMIKWCLIAVGEHSYLEVTENLSNTKREAVKLVIELSFRAEFEMARTNEEYKQLVKRLPEVFVGKAERLRGLVKIMCSAAKKCMKEKKMHIGPWRKHKYMQAKWFGTRERSTMEPLLIMNSSRIPKPKASMLTFDLMENIHGLHCTTVEVMDRRSLFAKLLNVLPTIFIQVLVLLII
ncbi:unnamed protein product [Sphenostylis stenocarpa]|uniref:Uncharacterized protein n=1 Tax=Sphenostylis stenocarpa TaxID=92480 RepID=A0AA86W5B4_9FABA|nr:unnamed protein product [Sphenostylis stenocarpa]